MVKAMSLEPPAISPPWLNWLRDFRVAASGLILKATAESSNEADQELQSMKFALYARALTLFDTACLLAENDKLLDLRSSCRGIIECAMHMDAAQSKPDYVKTIKDDDTASRRSRAKRYQAAANPETRKIIGEFLNRDSGRAKRSQPTNFAKGSQFSRLIHVYHEISADTAHVTFTSLARHFSEDKDSAASFIVDPALPAEELHETLITIALSGLLCTFLLLRSLSDTCDATEFENLMARYNLLYRAGLCPEG